MTTWVLLRGLMRDSRHWGEFPLLFQNAMDEKRVVALDFPGNGSLHAQTSIASVTGMAEYCHSQLGRLGYDPPYHVLALSLGGMVAVAWSEMYSNDIGAMVLINTSLAAFNPFYHRLRPYNYPAMARLLYGTVEQQECLILRLTSSLATQSERRQTILEQWVSFARECPVTRANMLRQLLAAIRYRAAPAAPTVPVLLLAGQQDQLVNVKCSLTLAQKWRCAIRLHPTAGHDIPLDDAAWVTQQVLEWPPTSVDESPEAALRHSADGEGKF